MLQEIQVRGGVKNDPIRRGGGGGWIFSGITHYFSKRNIHRVMNCFEHFVLDSCNSFAIRST